MGWPTALLLILGLALLVGLTWQAIDSASDARKYPAPGRLIDVGGYRLHIRCAGQGGLTVVLESGIAASSLSWAVVQPHAATFTRVCSYDRAGLAWSDAARSPRTSRQIVYELHTLLEAAGIPGPYVLVGHSFGALLARAFAGRYPDQVAGLILLDPIHISEWFSLTPAHRRMVRGAVLMSRLGGFLALIGIVRGCLALLIGGAPEIPRSFVGVFGPTVAALLGHIVEEVRKLPQDVWPVIAALWCHPKCFASMADHLAALPESVAEEARASDDLGNLPVVIVVTDGDALDRVKRNGQLAHLSSNVTVIVASKSGHWIQLDEPDLVVSTIREVVEARRHHRPS